MTTRRNTLNTLDEFREFCKDKRILLVGNNLTALERKQARIIDNYDIVVRFGKGIQSGFEEYIGSKTDVWMTGEFRRDMHRLLSKDVVCLYNPSFIKKAEPPSWQHVKMFDPAEAKEINKEFCKPGDRLSAGAFTSLFFFRKVKTYKELAFINFDFFQGTGKFTDAKHNIDSYASSWHLPLLKPKDIPVDPLNNPVHAYSAEKAVFNSVEDERVNFIGLSYDRPTYLKLQNAAWDKIRRPNNS
jgi:hypothetical protein